MSPLHHHNHAGVDEKPAHVSSGSPTSSDNNMVERLEHFDPGYAHDRDLEHHHMEIDEKKQMEIDEANNPNIHHHMNPRLFLGLTAMSFCWIGSQIPLYLYGSVLPDIYSEVGGADGRWLWMVVGYLIPVSALCPFVGAMSDLIGRKKVAAIGQVLLIIGPIVVSTAHQINTAIGGMVISGLGAGLNELIALAGTSEMVPVSKRGGYVGLVVFTILPFCPSALWAQLISAESNWRWVGLLVGVWNFVGLVLVALFYKDPVILEQKQTKKQILKEIDYIGGFLSTAGVTCFMMGLQWGAEQYTWKSAHVLVPFLIGVVTIIVFFIYEAKLAKYPMLPPAIFSRDKRTMVAILLITFFSGGNFFVLLLFWPTQTYNMYGANALHIGIRTLPIGFGIIGGAVIALLLIGVTKGRTTILMIFWTALMTGFVGAMSVATTTNLYPTVYGILTFAAIGVGAVIIPCSIIAQIVCPVEYIGTITAITLSIRYIGGAIGFTVYYNVFYHKFYPMAEKIGYNLALDGISFSIPTLTELVTLASDAEYDQLQELIATSPLVMKKDMAYNLIINQVQEAFAQAYRWPYWISIAFGGVCLVSAFFLRDIRRFM